MVINKMNKTKVIIGSVAVVALTLAIVGLASAQIVASQTYTGASSNNDLWGWMSNCLGFRNSQHYANQYVAPPTGTNNQVPTQSQGNSNYFGFGPCWARFDPSP
jgi:hypothetical protein